jgi:hypothetical protein
MKIKTKFTKEDKVFHLEDGKIKSFIIKSISINVKDYCDRNTEQQAEYYSSDIYGSKDFINGKLLYKDIDKLFSRLKLDYEMQT